MKKYIFTIIFVLIASSAFTAGFLGRDKDKNLVQDFMPSVFGLIQATKADMTLDVTTSMQLGLCLA